MFQRICRSLQNVISKASQENEEVAQIICEEFCEQRLCINSSLCSSQPAFWPFMYLAYVPDPD